LQARSPRAPSELRRRVPVRGRARERGGFKAVYGPNGEWARFFSRGDGYEGAELWRRADRYLVIDRWRSEAAYEDFLRANADEHRRRTQETTRLYVSEQALGRDERA
jgi:heme-degrading monooxygenase HmoA